MLGLWLPHWLATEVNTGAKILMLQTDFSVIGYWSSTARTVLGYKARLPL